MKSTPGEDFFAILESKIVRDTLRLSVQYSGGCKTHSFSACWEEGLFLESFPVQAQLEVHHDGKGDFCEALITEELSFNLALIKRSYRHLYGARSGSVIVRLGNRGQSILYRF